jgi:hypothetical protein
MSTAAIANNRYKKSNIRQDALEGLASFFQHYVDAQFEISNQYTNTPFPFLFANPILINEKEVELFLNQHPSLKTLLPIILRLATEEFPQSRYELEVITDPESKKPDKTLFLYIITDLNPKKALSALENLDGKIFKNNLDIDVSIFNFNLKFK